MKKFTAPQLDRLIRVLEDRDLNPAFYDKKTNDKINKLYELFDKVKPVGEDNYLELYFSVKRGSIKNYGDFEELKQDGEVDSYEEFENNFKEEYPDDVYWYCIETKKVDNYRFISINSKNVICADMNKTNDVFIIKQRHDLLDFLIYEVSEIIKMLENNTYNDYVANNISYKNRFGIIKRSDYWNIYPDFKKKLNEYISEEEINEFVNSASATTNNRIKDMTANIYYESVKLAYQNNNYDIGDLSAKDLYLKYADGRDEGLRDINPDSSKEFDDWYNDENKFGGHPWEIMRGHSFYRVNLSVQHDNNGYYLSLYAPILRKIEAAKIYLALKKNNIPIQIYNIDVIKDALTGNDYLGIVPDYLIPIYCESYFKEYKAKEFIHIDDEKILSKVVWLDIDKIYLK